MNTEQTSKNIVTYKTRIYITPDFIDGKEIKESIEYKKKTVFVGDSIIKDLQAWEISDRENKFVVRCFPGAKYDDKKSYVIDTIKQNPETTVINCG